MASTRNDAWTQDEDLLLAEVVLRHIREGGTQLQAFEEVGKQLSRTSAACGFRWNSYLRKHYTSAIKLAKEKRKEIKKDAISKEGLANVEQVVPQAKGKLQEEGEQGTQITFSSVLHFLEGIYIKTKETSSIEEEREELSKRIKELEEKTYYLKSQNEKLSKDLKEIEEDYRTLMIIMNRARKMVATPDK